MWFLSPEQQKEQADLARAVNGPMRAWWRRNRTFWIVAGVLIALLFLVYQLDHLNLLLPSQVSSRLYRLSSFLLNLEFYAINALHLLLLLVWWLAALRVNRVLDGIVADAALPRSPLIPLVRFEQALKQGIAPILSGAVLLLAYAIIKEIVASRYGMGLGSTSFRILSESSSGLLDLLFLPVLMIWALALLALLPHRPLIGALLPAGWALFNELAVVCFYALWIPIGSFLPMIQDSSNRHDFYYWEQPPSLLMYFAFYLIGLALMLSIVFFFRRWHWLARALLGIQLALLFCASLTAEWLELWIAKPGNAMPGGILVDMLHAISAACYEPIITAGWLGHYSSPSMIFGWASLRWEQLFKDYPLIFLLVAIAINIAGLLLLKELAGWAVYRAELSATGKFPRSAE